MATADERYMRLALRAGRRGLGRTSPNPAVGAVIVRNDRVIASGYHHRAGEPHAEVEALRAAGAKSRGATIYVTLEPCAHHGRTGPCTQAVLDAGIRRVVIGSLDPNPRVAGGGAEMLRAAGLKVEVGVLQRECDELLAFFRKHVTTGLPFVTLKLAATLDGRIATATGASRWITGEASRRLVHRWRNEHDAILVGAETVLHDDPELTCRLRGGRHPVRVVVDGRLRMPLTSKLVRSAGMIPTLVLTARGADATRVKELRAAGVQVIALPARGGRMTWPRMMQELGRRNLASVLVEGGAEVAAGLLAARQVDRLSLFLAPKLIGGDGRAVLASLGVQEMADAVTLPTPRLRRVGEDVLYEADFGK